MKAYELLPGDKVNIRVNGKITKRRVLSVGLDYVKVNLHNTVEKVFMEQVTSYIRR